MDLDAVGVVVVHDFGDGVELFFDVHDLSFAGDGVDEVGFGLELLVSVVPVLIETEHHDVGRILGGR